MVFGPWGFKSLRPHRSSPDEISPALTGFSSVHISIRGMLHPSAIARESRLADDGAGRRTDLADRRTSLANERTLLAWWRTGLTALAVALGVGRLLPELAPHETRWPFVAIGVAFAVYGIALFLYGTRRSGDRLLTDGGRVITLVGRAGSVDAARQRAYRAVTSVHFDGMQHRNDIGLETTATA